MSSARRCARTRQGGRPRIGGGDNDGDVAGGRVDRGLAGRQGCGLVEYEAHVVDDEAQAPPGEESGELMEIDIPTGRLFSNVSEGVGD